MLPDELSPDERTRELAVIFATALTRLSRAVPPSPSQTSPKNSRNELAVSAEKSVTVHAG